MTRRLTFIALTVALAVAGFSEGSGQRGQNPSQVEPLPEVPPRLQFVPLAVAERMLDLASVTSSDVVYDLGCGDGRLAIVAAKKFGARAVGVDVDAKRIAEAAANAGLECLTLHVGWGMESDDEGARLIEAILESSGRHRSAPL